MVAAPAFAAGPDAALLRQLSGCATISKDAARLACFDSLAPRVNAALAAPQSGGARMATGGASIPPPPPTPEEQTGWFGFDMGSLFGDNSAPERQTTPEQFGADKTQAEQQTRAAREQKQIDHITEPVADYAFNPFGKFIVTLQNGQIWKELPSESGRVHFKRKAEDNTVTIERGMLGSYMLSINGGNRGFKVTRVK